MLPLILFVSVRGHMNGFALDHEMNVRRDRNYTERRSEGMTDDERELARIEKARRRKLTLNRHQGRPKK